MRIRELLSGNIKEDYVNPHTMSPGVVPSFAGPRAPNTPQSPMPLEPPMPAPGGRTSMATPGGAPGQMAQNDQVNPHFVAPGTIPSFAGPHPTIPGQAPTSPSTPSSPVPGRIG